MILVLTWVYYFEFAIINCLQRLLNRKIGVNTTQFNLHTTKSKYERGHKLFSKAS